MRVGLSNMRDSSNNRRGSCYSRGMVGELQSGGKTESLCASIGVCGQMCDNRQSLEWAGELRRLRDVQERVGPAKFSHRE
jgi:hypothetical protein